MPELDHLRGIPEPPRQAYRKWVWIVAFAVCALVMVWVIRTALHARRQAKPIEPPAAVTTGTTSGASKVLARLNGRHPLPETPIAPQGSTSAPVPSPGDDGAARRMQEMTAMIEQLRRQLDAQAAQKLPEKPKAAPAAQPRTMSEAEKERREYEKARAKARETIQSWSRDRDQEANGLTTVKPYASKYTVAAGTSIPCSIRQALTSKIPGAFRADVEANIYDTATGEYLIVPQGGWFILSESGQSRFGQNRIQAQVHELHWPNLHHAKIAGASLTDTAGKAGVTQRVNQHWGNLTALVLVNIFHRSTQTAMAASGAGAVDRLAGNAAQEATSQTSRKVEQIIDITPTIQTDNAWPCQIFLTENLSLTQPYTPVVY